MLKSLSRRGMLKIIPGLLPKVLSNYHSKAFSISFKESAQTPTRSLPDILPHSFKSIPRLLSVAFPDLIQAPVILPYSFHESCQIIWEYTWKESGNSPRTGIWEVAQKEYGKIPSKGVLRFCSAFCSNYFSSFP